MTDWLRRAGRGHIDRDCTVLWSVAEGSRGWRWRWEVTEPSGPSVVGLAERLPSGAFGRLELTTAGGLLTFHPDPTGTSAHGNIVAVDGVRPIAVDWSSAWAVGIKGDPFGSAVCGWSGAGFVVSLDGLVWREPGTHDDVPALACDERGIPILVEPAEWPLEE